jgi:hypothetical protein
LLLLLIFIFIFKKDFLIFIFLVYRKTFKHYQYLGGCLIWHSLLGHRLDSYPHKLCVTFDVYRLNWQYVMHLLLLLSKVVLHQNDLQFLRIVIIYRFTSIGAILFSHCHVSIFCGLLLLNTSTK